MSEAAVLTEVVDGVLVVTINRPEAKNAANGEVARGIAAAMDELDGNDALRVGILTGAGGTFCAGMDLKGFLTGDLPIVEGRGFAGVAEAPPRKPLIAAVEGYALAGGFELAITCDLIVAAETSKFGITEVKRGLVAAGGGLVRLPRQIPPRLAMEFAIVGDFVTAGRAYDMGLVNRVVPLADLEKESMRVARRLALVPALSLKLNKKAINNIWEQSGLREALTHNAGLVAIIHTTDVPEWQRFRKIQEQHGFKAFLEARDKPFRDLDGK